MQTNISEKYKNTAHGQEAEAILRACVHCGFCTATCPTYQLLGDELDGRVGVFIRLNKYWKVSQPPIPHACIWIAA